MTSDSSYNVMHGESKTERQGEGAEGLGGGIGALGMADREGLSKVQI